jgi:hypothetical protein
MKGRLLKGKKLIYGVYKKQDRAVWFENMGVCRYREVVCFEITSLLWHNSGETGGYGPRRTLFWFLEGCFS